MKTFKIIFCFVLFCFSRSNSVRFCDCMKWSNYSFIYNLLKMGMFLRLCCSLQRSMTEIECVTNSTCQPFSKSRILCNIYAHLAEPDISKFRDLVSISPTIYEQLLIQQVQRAQKHRWLDWKLPGLVLNVKDS